jgi:hypothetical protein
MMIGRAPSPGLPDHHRRLPALRLLPTGDRDKDVEIHALRHQITILERQLGDDTRMRSASEDRALLAVLLTSLPREALRQLRLLVRPDTVLRRHRDLLKWRHALTCRPKGLDAHPRSHPGFLDHVLGHQVRRAAVSHGVTLRNPLDQGS